MRERASFATLTQLPFSGPAPVERIGPHPRSETSQKLYSCRWASQYCTFEGRSTGKTGRERLLKEREASWFTSVELLFVSSIESLSHASEMDHV